MQEIINTNICETLKSYLVWNVSIKFYKMYDQIGITSNHCSIPPQVSILLARLRNLKFTNPRFTKLYQLIQQLYEFLKIKINCLSVSISGVPRYLWEICSRIPKISISSDTQVAYIKWQGTIIPQSLWVPFLGIQIDTHIHISNCSVALENLY